MSRTLAIPGLRERGSRFKRLPAWFMHRTYHLSRIPSFNWKVRVVAYCAFAFVLRRETIALGRQRAPREEFTHVTLWASLSEDREPVGARAH